MGKQENKYPRSMKAPANKPAAPKAQQSKITPKGFEPQVREGGVKPKGKGLPWGYGRGQAKPAPYQKQNQPQQGSPSVHQRSV